MSVKTKEFEFLGYRYRTIQFTAVTAMELMDKGLVHPTTLLANTTIERDGVWHGLGSRPAISKFVEDKTGIVAPRLVLDSLMNVVSGFNFGFVSKWKGAKVPSRMIDDAKTIESFNVDPMLSHLMQNDVASLRELEEYYSLEDAFKMFDVLTVKGVNAALAHENAMKKAKKK